MKYLGTVYGIDPGSKQSAYVHLEDEMPVKFDTLSNIDILHVSRNWQEGATIVIENYTPWSTLSHDIQDTLIWIGRFYQSFVLKFSPTLLPRDQIKRHLLGRTSGKDSQIKAEMERRYGPKGIRSNPGALYGIKKDEWQALAAARTWIEIQKLKQLNKDTVQDITGVCNV